MSKKPASAGKIVGITCGSIFGALIVTTNWQVFQTDALWLNFGSISYGRPELPVALKIGAGKINAVSGEKWVDGLNQDPQNYVVLPEQPWLDGFNVE